MFELSIILVNYNSGDYLKQCVDSIRKTTDSFKDPKCEVIIIDNKSSDKSFEKVGETDKIRKFSNKANLGFSRAVNEGIDLSRGKYILLLNPDTISTKDAIKRLYRFALSNKHAGVVGGRLKDPSGNIQPSVFNFPNLLGAIKEYWLGKRGTFSKFYPQTSEPLLVDAVVGAVFLITPESLKKVGKLDEKYFMYYEDIDYCKRVKEAGLGVYYLPGAIFRHAHGVSGKNQPSLQNERLISSSKKYNGVVRYYLLVFIIKVGRFFGLSSNL